MNVRKPALYLLPGLLCDETVWRAQLEYFSPRVDVVVPDYGNADSINAMAKIVLKDAPDRFSLAGHSMGARVALEVMRMAPEKVERLGVFDTGVHNVRPDEYEKRMRLVNIASDEGMAALCDIWLPPMVHPACRDNDAFMQPLRDMVMRFTPDRFAAQIKALLTRPDAAAALAAVRCPVLIGVGRQDEWSPIDQHEDIRQCLSGRQPPLVIFEGAGHMAPYEASQSVNSALADWFVL